MSTDGVRRLGLTMRVVGADGYREERDALAHDWHVFMAAAMPECVWVPVPNVGKGVVPFVGQWGLTGVILTGGNDVGAAPARDETETALIAHGLERRLPLFGVCRGLQMLQRYFGGALERCPRDAHVATRHEVGVVDPEMVDRRRTLTVNSFHDWGVRETDLVASLRPVAVAAGGWVEAAVGREHPVMGVMWHPERERPFQTETVAIVRRFFGLPPAPPPA
jgi:putative glutamine amidotransferase